MSTIDFTQINPVSKTELAAFPLIADTQFAEQMGSESFNRKFTGIVPAGIYRGFNCIITGDNQLAIGSDPKNTAAVERDGQLITVVGQHPVNVIIPYDVEVAVVIEAISQHGLLTNQVDKNSFVTAATIKVVPVAEILPHHVVIVTVLLPAGSVLTNDILNTAMRTVAGLNNTPTFEQADERYQLKGEYVTQDQLHEGLSSASDLHEITEDSLLPQSGTVMFISPVNGQLVVAPDKKLLTVIVSREINFSAEKPALLAPAGEAISSTAGSFSKLNFGSAGTYRFRRSAGQWIQI